MERQVPAEFVITQLRIEVARLQYELSLAKAEINYLLAPKEDKVDKSETLTL